MKNKRSAKNSFSPPAWHRPQRMNGHWVFWFYESMYRENIYLIWPVTEQQRIDFIKKKFGIDRPIRAGHWDGTVTEVFPNADHAGGQIISFREWCDDDPLEIALLAHECFHVANNILSARGVRFTNNPNRVNEPYAYLIQRIVESCLRAMLTIKSRDRKSRK